MHFFVSRSLLFVVSLAAIFGMVEYGYAVEVDIIKNVIKIKTYEPRSDGSFVFKSFGSAIAIGPSRILTNAHVILGADGVPTGHYEACFSTEFEKVPVCREIARLIAYDIVADLAILELPHTDSLVPFSFSKTKIALGSSVSMYGYPAIGGETITRTEGKIAGYEEAMYKIDGSIDHGNSGGGAFDNALNLVGIPTAVASDNASIGYMIPLSRIQLFLSKRTNNYTEYSQTPNRSFSKFLVRNQSFTATKPVLSWKDIQVKNPRPYGFTLKSSMVSSDASMLNWVFVDSYDRVKVTISCTDDAGGLPGWQVRRDGLVREQETYPSWNMSAQETEDIFTVYSSSKGYNPSITLYYKFYDACFAEVNYLDEKMDNRSVKKALSFLQNGVSFRSPYTLKSTQENQYFKIPHTEKDTRIIRSIDSFGVESTLIGIEIEKNNWINAVIEGKTYDTLDELSSAFDIDFASIQTWKDYVILAIKSGLSSADVSLIDLSSGQRGILFSRYDADKKITTIVFEYTYMTDRGHYAYWTWTGNYSGNEPGDMSRLKAIFASLIYPGKSILQ